MPWRSLAGGARRPRTLPAHDHFGPHARAPKPGSNTQEGDRAAALLLIGLSLFVLGLVLARVVTTERVGADAICGAIAVYLLIGVVWAVCYSVIEALAPGSFGFTDPSFDKAWNELLYFSLVTLTTLGYGDITPVGAVARIWSALEAVTGTLYLAVLIARLVSLYRQ